ncbi:MAG: DUF1926 domain-containing protein [Treponema sp.]|jgi:hypothetical protein|nr:DUF1926 domain-containing protein [Treponema sp.]
MDGGIKLILGSHKHVAWGSPEEDFQDLYEKELKPMLTALYKFPRINMTLHYSGVLLQWVTRNRPEFSMLIKDLLRRKQVELLGGGFYEPLLPLLPLTDKIGQIEMLTASLRRQFGKRPLGCWLPAFAWEQNLVGPLNNSGMLYTFLDESQFTAARGEADPGKTGYVPCFTEDQGKLITVFPVASRFHASYGTGLISSALKKMQDTLSGGGNDAVVSLFPAMVPGDGESPEFFYHRIFEEFSRAGDNVEYTSPGKQLKTAVCYEKLYFPSSIASEKDENAYLPRQALLDYPETNSIYTRMMFTHVLISQLRGDKSRKRTAREEFWKAQGCDVFYNGKDGGGISRKTVRQAAYRALLEAEKITREKGTFVPSLSIFDLDMDGRGECLFQGEKINCYIRSRGAAVFELDYLPRPWNYLDTFDAQETGKKVLFKGAAFRDFIVPNGASLESLEAGRVPGGRALGDELFEIAEIDRSHDRIRFVRDREEGLPFGGLGIEKTFQLKKDTIRLLYSIKNEGERKAEFHFVPRLDLSLEGEGSASGLAQNSSTDTVEFREQKNGSNFLIRAGKVFNLNFKAVHSPGKAGEYQYHALFPRFPVSLEAGTVWELEFTLKISNSGK